MPKLIVELKACMKKFDFLLVNRHLLQEDDLETNATAFRWPGMIKPEFAKIVNKLQDDRDKFEELVKSRVEEFAAEMARIKAEIEGLNLVGDKTLEKRQLTDQVATIEAYRLQLDEALENDSNKPSALSINTEEEQLGWVKTNFQDIQDSLELLKPLGTLWSGADNIIGEHTKWMNGPFIGLKAEDIRDAVDTTIREMKGLKRTFKEHEAPLSVATAVSEKMDKFQEHLPLIEYLCHPGLRDRHWTMIEEKVGYSIKPDEFSTLTRIIEQRLEPFLKDFEEISFAASKEYNLEKSLDTMSSEWEEVRRGQPTPANAGQRQPTPTQPTATNCNQRFFARVSQIDFPFAPYPKNEELSVIANLDDIQMLLDDHIVKTQTMKSNSFIGPFEERTKAWETTLLLLQDAIDVWMAVQATWMYLEPIFGSEDIMKQMPVEGKMFQTVDASWKEVMTAATADPKVLVVVKIPHLVEKLGTCNELLEKIQKGLNDYLETK